MKILRYIPAAVVFVIMACYMLIAYYSDMLYTAQDRSVFVASSLFFNECVTRPFGLMQYLGSYLTQFFYIPALGASLLVAIWTATYAAGVKAFNMTSRWAPLLLLPLACLLASIVNIGYWIYCFQIPGYWFSQSLAYLVMMLLLWAFRITPEKWQGVWYVVVALMFPILGWTGMLMAVCMFIMQIVRRIAEKRKGILTRDNIITVAGAFIALAAPKIIWSNILYQKFYGLVVMYGGFPVFENSTSSSMRPVIPFYILIGLTLLFALFTYINIAWDKSKVITKLHINHVVITIIVAAAAAYGVWQQRFDDYNYFAEMRMMKAVMEEDWQMVIAEERQAPVVPSRTMVMLKNIALMNTEGLGEYSFEIDGNSGNEIYNPDSLNLNTMIIASPLIYYNYGHMNFAIRWCMENALGYGFSPFYLKNLIRCADAKGEKELKERYLARLNKSQFYADWKPKQPTQLVKDLTAIHKDVLGQDGNSCERYLIETLSDIRQTKSPAIQEMALFYAILLRDASKFWPAFLDYVATHQNKTIPKHFQEAFVMFYKMRPVELPFDVDINPDMARGFLKFYEEGQGYADKGMDPEGVSSMLQSSWGGTYWWYNAFGRSKY